MKTKNNIMKDRKYRDRRIKTKTNIRECDRRKKHKITQGKTERESDRMIKTKNNDTESEKRKKQHKERQTRESRYNY